MGYSLIPIFLLPSRPGVLPALLLEPNSERGSNI